MTTMMYLLVALVVLPFLVRIATGKDSAALLTVLAILGYAAYLTGFIRF